MYLRSYRVLNFFIVTMRLPGRMNRADQVIGKDGSQDISGTIASAVAGDAHIFKFLTVTIQIPGPEIISFGIIFFIFTIAQLGIIVLVNINVIANIDKKLRGLSLDSGARVRCCKSQSMEQYFHTNR